MVRQNRTVLLRSKQLFQQFFYFKIETEHLQFLWHEQKASQADCYQDLQGVVTDKDWDPNNVGHRK